MTYISGVMGSTADPTVDFVVDVLHPALLAEGFVYIEEYTGYSTYRVRIYQSPAALNGVVDWYLYVTNSGSSLSFALSEGYDSVNHRPIALATVLSSGSNTPLAADGTYNTTFSSTWSGTVANTNTYTNVQLAAAGFSYWISVNINRVIVATRVTNADYASYVGLFENWLGSSIQPYPIVYVSPGSSYGYSNTPGNGGAATREPGVTVAGSYLNALGRGARVSAFVNAGSFGNANDFTNTFFAYPLTVSTWKDGASTICGALLDCVQLYSGGANGDTLMLDGKEWVCMKWGSIDVFVDTTA